MPSFYGIAFLVVAVAVSAATALEVRVTMERGTDLTFSLNAWLDLYLRPRRPSSSAATGVVEEDRCVLDPSKSPVSNLDRLKESSLWSVTEAVVRFVDFSDGSLSDSVTKVDAGNTFEYKQGHGIRTGKLSDTEDGSTATPGASEYGAPTDYGVGPNYARGTFDVYCTRNSASAVMRNVSIVIDVVDTPRAVSSQAAATLRFPGTNASFEPPAAALDSVTISGAVYDSGEGLVTSVVSVVGADGQASATPPSRWACTNSGDLGESVMCELAFAKDGRATASVLPIRVDPVNNPIERVPLPNPIAPLNATPAYRSGLLAVASIDVTVLGNALLTSSSATSDRLGRLPIWLVTPRATLLGVNEGTARSTLVARSLQPYVPNVLAVGLAIWPSAPLYTTLRSHAWAYAGRPANEIPPAAIASLNVSLNCKSLAVDTNGLLVALPSTGDVTALTLTRGRKTRAQGSAVMAFTVASACAVNAPFRLNSAVALNRTSTLTVAPAASVKCTCGNLTLEPDLRIPPMTHLGIEPSRWGSVDPTGVTQSYLESSDRAFRRRGGILFTPTAGSATVAARCAPRFQNAGLAPALTDPNDLVIDWDEEPALTQAFGRWFELTPPEAQPKWRRVRHSDDQLFCVWHRAMRRCLRSDDSFHPRDILLAAFGEVAEQLAAGGEVANAAWSRIAALTPGVVQYKVGANDWPLCDIAVSLRAPPTTTAQRPTVTCRATFMNADASDATTVALGGVAFSPFACEQDGNEIGPTFGGRSALDLILGGGPIDSVLSTVAAPTSSGGGGLALIQQVLRRWRGWGAVSQGSPATLGNGGALHTPLYYAIRQFAKTIVTDTVRGSDEDLVTTMLFGRSVTPACLLGEGSGACTGSDLTAVLNLLGASNGESDISVSEALVFIGQRLHLSFAPSPSQRGVLTRRIAFANATHDVVIEVQRRDAVLPPRLLVGGLACTPPLGRGLKWANKELYDYATPEELYGVHNTTMHVRTDNYGKVLYLTLIGGHADVKNKIRVGSAPTGRAYPWQRTFSAPPDSWSVEGNYSALPKNTLIRCLRVTYMPPKWPCFDDPAKFALCPRRLTDQLVLAASDGSGILSNAVVINMDIEAVLRGSTLSEQQDSMMPSWTTVFLLLNMVSLFGFVFGMVRRRRNRERMQQRHVRLSVEDEDEDDVDLEALPAVKAARSEREAAEALPRGAAAVPMVPSTSKQPATEAGQPAEDEDDDADHIPESEAWRRELAS